MTSLLNNPKTELLFGRYRFVIHMLFWMGIVVYDVLIWGLVEGKYEEKIAFTLSELPIKIAAAYFTLYVLIDRFLIQKKYTQFLLLLVTSMLGVGLILRIWSYYVLYPIYYPDGLSMPLFFPPKILIAIFYAYSWVAIVSTFHLIRYYYQHQQATQKLVQTAQQLEKEKLAAELKLLKSQINPHFLFNTLNSLYVLTLNNSANAPQMVHKLSELMSYMLYDSNHTEVELEKEIQYVRNYIDLEKLRYGERLEVVFTNDVESSGFKIAPLIMLPLIENSFKHGARQQLNEAWIHIDLEVHDNVLTLKVENSKPESSERFNTNGFGLKNVTNRLQHIYPERYSLQLFDEVDTYLAILKLSLDNKPVQQRMINEHVRKTHAMPDCR